MRGSPIRTSSDQRSVGSSPRLIAASYVLHRLLVPRHPPCALNNLATQLQQPPPTPPADPGPHPPQGADGPAPNRYGARGNQRKMLASTVQFSTTNPRSPRRPHRPPPPPGRGDVRSGEPGPRQHTPPGPGRSRPAPRGVRSLRTQQRAYDRPLRPPRSPPAHVRAVLAAIQRQPAELVSVPPSSTTPDTRPGTPAGHRVLIRARLCTTTPCGHGGEMLLRKEVIQPHLPVRLPCYDFVPIADPAFDGSLPHGVGPPASGVTDFRDVTGGVYKARERIHRSVADLRLLATPTSWGRVADPNPN